MTSAHKKKPYVPIGCIGDLIWYNAAKAALAEAAKIDEVAGIDDMVEKLRLYAQITKDIDVEHNITRIKLRAMRRIGEICKELDKAEHSDAGEHGCLASNAALKN